MRMLVLLLSVPLLALAGPPATADSEAGWYHVTFPAPITQVDRDAVEAAGGVDVAALPSQTYVAWFDAEPTVSGAAVTLRGAADKVDPYLAGGGLLHLLVLLHEDGAADATTRFLPHGEVVAVRAEPTGERLHAAYVTADLAGARAIARDRTVLYVGPAPTGFAPDNERSAQIVAGNLGDGPGYEGWLQEVGVTGAGVNVTIVDTGVDPRHPDLAPALTAKIERSQSPTGEPADTGGHGSHVAGIVAGRGLGLSSTGLIPRPTEGGFLQGLGVAPGAGLVDQNVLATSAAGPLCGNTWPPAEWEPLAADALAADSHIWNASWHSCEGVGAGYTHSASEMDRLTRDGDSSLPGGQPFTMVFSAGNSGAGSGDTDTRLTAPKEAKNTIVVASLDVAAPDRISSFSSRGPARDGRIVPTVAAPGGGVLSTRSTTATISCASPYAAVPDGALYAACSGTSMAAPHVAGAVALITEWWRLAHDGADPSPAMVKALLVNSAVDMGQPDIPNRHEGWGRVHLGNLFDAEAVRTFVDESQPLDDPGDTHVVEIDVDDGPLRVSLVWTDQPAVPGAQVALVNDLDLVVTAPDGTEYRGNRFLEGASVAGDGHDRLNNVENVFLAAAEAGTWTITVRAHALPGDGNPFAGDQTDQDFALVVTS